MSYRFALSCEDPGLERRAAELIGAFASPLDTAQAVGLVEAEPVSYSLLCGEGGGPPYGLSRGDRQVLESDDPEIVLSRLLWQVSSDTVESAEGYLLIHAGVVASAGGEGLVILGESGSGKTTLVAALVQEGFGFLSDEAAAIEIGTGLAHPWTRPLGFKQGSRSLERFAPLFTHADPAQELHVPVDRIRARAVVGPTPVRHVIDYRYRDGADTRLEPVSRAESLARMGSAAPRLRREGARGLELLTSVMRGARGHRLVSGELERGVRAVRELVER